MTDFTLWEKELREEVELPHNKPTDLALKTLELCLKEIEIIDHFEPSGEPYQHKYSDTEYEIASNNFAILDFATYIYFNFSLYLAEKESASFLEEYDRTIQKLLILYAGTELDFPNGSASKFLRERLQTYDTILSENIKSPREFSRQSIDALVVFIERDLLENPFGNEYPIISFFEDFYLKLKVRVHLLAVVDKLIDFRNKITNSNPFIPVKTNQTTFTNDSLKVNTESLQEQIEKFQATQNQSPQPKKKRRRGLFSSRVSAIISIILCIVMYWTLLTTVYTTKVDTYICYITETGDCYHAANCRYLWNSAQQTTVYEVLGEYRSCSYCNPKVDKYETRITKKNYKAPFFISAPTSIVLYFVIKKDD